MENEAALLYVTMQEGAKTSTCSYNMVYNFLVYLLPLKSPVFVVQFQNAFWLRNNAFSKGSFQNEMVPLLIIFHLPYSKQGCANMLLLVSLLKSKFFTRFALMLFVQHSCCTHVVRVALALHLCHTCVACVSLVLHSFCSCCNRVARVWRSPCKLDQIFFVQHVRAFCATRTECDHKEYRE